VTARSVPNTRGRNTLPPEVSALLSQLSEDERAKFQPLLDGVVADLHKVEIADLWEQRDFAASYWFLVSTGVNQTEEMKIASELLCWKHFFAKDTALVRCVQSSDQRDMECCFSHFGIMEYPTLIVSDNLVMSNFIIFGPDALEILASKHGALNRFLSRTHQWLSTGTSLRDVDIRFRTPGWWAQFKLDAGSTSNLTEVAVRSSWSMQPSLPLSSRSPIARLKWRPGNYHELAKYVDRNAVAIETLLDRARTALGAGFGGMYAMSKFAADREIASAIYEAIRGNTRLQYEFEPPTPGEEEQEIRLAREVLVSEAATCIDLALLFAAALEAAGAAPAIVVVQRRTGPHAIGGFFERGTELDVEHIVSDPDAIRALVDTGKVRLIETTGLSSTKGKKKPFDRACDEATGLIKTDTPLAVVNIMAARKLGLKPPA
jgi:hypothetical protein